jgi:hypothetical protein
MVLKSKEIKEIENFVAQKPRSIQEISEFLKVSWRTADRYIEEIKQDLGTLETRVFRGGTRGALKIVFLAGVEKISHSVFQEQLEKDIFAGRKKEDFSAFEIYQHINEKNKKAIIKTGENETLLGKLSDFTDLLRQAKKQVLFFSGNLSFINFKDKKEDVLKSIEELVKRGISIKVICRVDIGGIENIKKLLALNFKYGKELIEIHHKEQPLRVTIIDNHLCNLKEIKNPTGREKELNKKVFIFYTIKDKDWTDWLLRVFWKMFSQSIDANKRIEEINKLEIK